MTVSLATPVSGFLLRACAVEFAAATPSTLPVISALISALTWVDVRTPGNRTLWAGPHARVVAGGCATGAPTGETVELAALVREPAPHVFVAHGASALRMRLPAGAGRGLPWICTHRAACTRGRVPMVEHLKNSWPGAASAGGVAARLLPAPRVGLPSGRA